MSVCLSVSLLCSLVRPSVCLSFCLSLFFFLIVCPSVGLPACLSVSLYACLSVCLSVAGGCNEADIDPDSVHSKRRAHQFRVITQLNCSVTQRRVAGEMTAFPTPPHGPQPPHPHLTPTSHPHPPSPLRTPHLEYSLQLSFPLSRCSRFFVLVFVVYLFIVLYRPHICCLAGGGQAALSESKSLWI